MTGETSQPPTAWRYCGNQIKLWRTQAGISREELGREAGYEYESVKSMEQGRRRPAVRLLEVADEMCGARGLLLAARDYLQPEKVLSYVHDYMRYEAEAIAYCAYHPLLIPGLLQTEKTMRALFNCHWPPVDDETVEQRVAERQERQSMLGMPTKTFDFIIGESAVRNTLDNRAAHKRQLRHLLEVSEQRNVTILVMPTEGAHPGLNGSFVLLETAEHERLAYEEAQRTKTLYADPQRVSAVTKTYALIAARSLHTEESARFIAKVAAEI
ncbi:helix-turn-helix domain-containing protein [Streptomyces syringium]|uniref:Transcriptional regulator with XRE-family HTH domain n=1 Tax=Streptomyces syringium TaxID=76729 RepID=A0ABS4Y6A9_9ACTN|nr:helix-turn-helix transcriptional regulator [Streptomyces syringium]MBP2404256.1 transcriptional regulator with XRE-family HTH domain [Streptomyces syringium]